MKKGFILIIFTTLFIIFSPNGYPHGCEDHGPKENTECIKDSDGNCIESSSN